jgi:hypothetical protein
MFKLDDVRTLCREIGYKGVTSVIHRNRHVGDVVETALCAQTVTMHRGRPVKSLVRIEYTNWLVWLIVALALNVFVGMLMARR